MWGGFVGIGWDVASSGVEFSSCSWPQKDGVGFNWVGCSFVGSGYCNVLGRGRMGLDCFGWDVASSGGRVQFLFFDAEGWVGFDSFTILDRDTS